MVAFTKKGTKNAVGVEALADGGSVEYTDEGSRFIKRQWNHDGTAAHDSVISREEYEAATGVAKSTPASTPATPRPTPAKPVAARPPVAAAPKKL